MTRYPFTCLMLNGHSLRVQECNLLVETAAHMARNHLSEYEFADSTCTGTVTTDYKGTSLGLISGIIFQATVHSDRGTALVTYIFSNPHLLERNSAGQCVEIIVINNPSNRNLN